MKGTEHFKRTIQAFLEKRIAEDELFAANYRNPAKNIDNFTQLNEYSAIITSEYNMDCVKEWLNKNTQVRQIDILY